MSKYIVFAMTIAALLIGAAPAQAAVLQSIAVTPANPSVAMGLTQQFTATGTFSDNSTQNLTAQVTWASATTATATISASGLATAVAAGTSTVSATLGAISGSTVLTVTALVLQSIAVTPANPSVAKGLTQQFTATGTFSDNSTQNLTVQVTWASATTATATISASGLATAVAAGTSTVSATLGGISGSTVLTVTAPVLQSIAVTPANPSVAKGLTQQFTATGTFSDNSTQNLTAQVTWASATTATATISASGLATAVTAGTSTVSATLGGIIGSTVLTVTSVVCTDTVLHLHRAGTNLTLEAVAPATGPANFVDSPALSRSGGNPYRPIGVWEGYIDGIECDLVSLSDLHVWLGLRNGDDQGTNFDMKAEVWVNNLLVATAEDTCIKGVTRNPDLSLEIVRPLPIIQTAWGDSDVTLKLFARVGTPQDTCGGHSGATGLRLYFDSAIRDSRFDMTFKPGT